MTTVQYIKQSCLRLELTRIFFKGIDALNRQI
jgi:hypothetical protein